MSLQRRNTKRLYLHPQVIPIASFTRHLTNLPADEWRIDYELFQESFGKFLNRDNPLILQTATLKEWLNEYSLTLAEEESEDTESEEKRSAFEEGVARLLNNALEEKDSKALFLLAWLRKEGIGYQDGPDLHKALPLFLQAADEGGLAMAMFYLGHTYEKEDTVKDLDKAEHYYNLAADQGMIWAMHILGVSTSSSPQRLLRR